MISWYKTEKVRALDAALISGGVPADALMERAGSGVAGFIARLPVAETALILAGPGNNGGDGFVIARLLRERGWNVTVLLSCDPGRPRGEAALNLGRLDRARIRVLESRLLDDAAVESLCRSRALIVDALLGTGLSGEPRGETARLIRLLNGCRDGEGVLSVDAPSGCGSALSVRARWTCAVAARKTEYATGRGSADAGEVALIPLDDRAPDLLGAPDAMEMEPADARALLPRRREDDHKGKRGGVLIVAGSVRYRGAALLSARGALRAGAGLVVLASCGPALDALTCALPEAIGEPLDDPADLPGVMERWRKRCRALVVGPGLDRDERAERICRAASSWTGVSVWDGDGLYWLKKSSLAPANFCVTPHEGEAAFLLGEKAPLPDRFETAARLSRLGCPSLLKGCRSLVAEKGAVPLIVPRGGRVLSIPGSGDVLAGITGALLTAGLESSRALALAAWCHGAAGERLAARLGPDGALAAEVADAVPRVLKEMYDARLS